MLESILVGVVVLGAAYYWLRRLRRVNRGEDGCGCGGCGKCGQGHTAPGCEH